MFLEFLTAHNPALVDYGFYLLRNGLIEPDTYVLDLDRLGENARRLGETAEGLGLRCYFMAKQLGHNPLASRRVLEAGGPSFEGMVAVDFREARVLHRAGLPVRHLGHLVQVPSRRWEEALDMEPQFITLYSYDKARELSQAAAGRGRTQGVLLRMSGPGDLIYPGQEGGFTPEELPKEAERIAALPGLRIGGLTSFPCFLFDEEKGKVLPTPNGETLVRSAAALAALGFEGLKLNMPSCNSPGSLPLAASLGAAYVEPGHSLSGTSPDNPSQADPLFPALCYMTEVSHTAGGLSSCFGGGYYPRSRLQKALTSGGQWVGAVIPEPGAIDYYLRIPGNFPAGTGVCMAFRTQIFVTRSRLAVAEGLASSRPRLAGIWDSRGERISP
ncbi:MAG: alanine racemase [Spirochaetales bacterium]|jgi:predicted amino acid racemase|nr:alanine racemase [Spirochaetales bacterium]